MKDSSQKNRKLRQQRLRRHWTLQYVADELGTTVTTVQRWERGSQYPRLYYLGKLCALFDLSPQELGLEDTDLFPASDQAEVPEASDEAPEDVVLWTVPYARNPYFTGRDDLLELLTQQLAFAASDEPMTVRQVALTQAQALTGLGGIGKTQTAVEYAYRAREQERYRHILWITAASEEALLTSFVSLAEQLAFEVTAETDQHQLVRAVIAWLEKCHDPWLLIFDNADDLDLLLSYLPKWGHGCVLLTTRASAVGSVALPIEVETLSVMEGTHLLLRRAQRLSAASDEEINEASNLVIALGQFPLAIDQAGGYIEETGCSVQDYLQLYQRRRHALLARRGQHLAYPESVATTWLLSFERVKQANPAAAELLSLCALLSPDHIPEELLTGGAPCWPAALQQAVADPFSFNQMLAVLLQFSLVKRMSKDHLLSMHRLVQVVQVENMEAEEQRQWAERIVCATDILFPHIIIDEVVYWPQCQRLLEQAQACFGLIQEYHLHRPEAAALLDRTGSYLRERALYSLAEPLLLLALTINEQQSEPEQLPTATSLYHLALLYWHQGKYAQAEPLYVRALRIREQYLGSEHPDVADVLNDLGLLYTEQGKYVQAESLLLRGLRIDEQQLGPDHLQVAVYSVNLASLYQYQGKYAQAEPLYVRALRIHEQQSDPVLPLLAYSLHNLGALYWEVKKPDLAKPLFQRALQIREQVLGAEHPTIGLTLVCLAAVYYDQGAYGQAKPLCQRALHIYEQHLDPAHFLVAFPLHWLALVTAKEGKYEEAERLDQQALHIWEEHLGEMHHFVAYALHGLALLSAQQKRECEAEAFFQRALHIHEQISRERDLEMADILYDFADFQQTQGYLSEAASLYHRALAIREPTLGSEHALTIEVHKRLHTIQMILSK